MNTVEAVGSARSEEATAVNSLGGTGGRAEHLL